MADPQPRMLGVAHSDVQTAYFSIPSADWFVMFVIEKSVTENPTSGDIDREIRDRRETHEPRRFAAVVGGSEWFLRSYLEGVHEVEVLVLCADEDTLRRLGVPIVDEGWTPESRQQGTLDDYLTGRRQPGRRRGGLLSRLIAGAAATATDAAVHEVMKTPTKAVRTQIWRAGSHAVAGFVTDAGAVLEGDGVWARELGAVDSNGAVSRGEPPRQERIGAVDTAGRVTRGEFPREEEVGAVTADGEVRRGDDFRFDVVGTVAGPAQYAAGAALLLLFDES